MLYLQSKGIIVRYETTIESQLDCNDTKVRNLEARAEQQPVSWNSNLFFCSSSNGMPVLPPYVLSVPDGSTQVTEVLAVGG